MDSVEQLSIVKIGGQILTDPNALKSTIEAFHKIDGPKILVHGGGKKASELSSKMGIAPTMVNGRRITDEKTLDIVTMTYAGLINKKLVAQMQGIGNNAIGLSGTDGNLIKAHKRASASIDFGFAGDIDAINVALLRSLLNLKFSPVICSITHDKNGQLLNTNADTITNAIASAMTKLYMVSVYYIFEKKGVLLNIENEDSLINEISEKKFAILKSSKQVHSGMLPKLENAFEALKNGVKQIKIGQHQIISNAHAGTKIITA